MPGSHWMISLTPENYAATCRHGFTTLGVKTRHRRKAERMAPGDRVLYFLSQRNVFPAIATITSQFYQGTGPSGSITTKSRTTTPGASACKSTLICRRTNGLMRINSHPDCST